MLTSHRPAARALLRSLAPLHKATASLRARLPLPPALTVTRQVHMVEPGRKVSPLLSIPVQHDSEDEQQCQDARARGLFLARQERWGDLIQHLQEADTARAATGVGLPIADLMAFGARSDVVNGVEQALDHCPTPDDAPLLAGIMALEEARANMGCQPFMSALVASAHVDIGWAWRSDAAQNLASRTFEARAQAHFKRAWTLMEPLERSAADSPFLQEAVCAAMSTQGVAAVKLADAYAQLIELDPLNYRNMRALGVAMSPSRYGGGEALELEARRVASQTQNIWGAGGYTWTYFDALTSEDAACQSLDVPLFLEGLRDIVENRPSQETVNLLIAFCAIGINLRETATPEVTAVRAKIAEASNWLTRDHLQEIHPFHWAHAATGFANNAKVPSPRRFAARGRDDAHRFLEKCFHEELAQGCQVQFTEAGLEVQPS
ncbi:hypothetical protein GFB49_03975 [Epibacterium sp. SM1979]|uniref:Uncharacterized protein n=1 Tax=Tritonibacter litoralis TaxID=2662264 RepID=A0A843YDQ0_9RHOB|nr:hypothetical protein [Tritonibacter litoralis]MQQ07604.1 hypothetical protein [Tritonibacter litoralis]